MPALRWLVALLVLSGCGAAHAASRVSAAPVPQELRSAAFTVTVNGKTVDVAHAAANYAYASFDASGPVTVEITAAEPGFWDRGVDIEPWRLGIRPERKGQTIRFKLAGPAKLSITRPRDFLKDARMLFLFADKAAAKAPPAAEHVHVYAAGVYHESLNPKSGDVLYLAPGSYFFGSLNLWRVHDVRVLGRGTIIYDGPQNPNDDQGWMQKPDWHCIDSLESENVDVEGVTCLVRSRTWSIQLKDSSHFTFDDLRVIGGNPANANQDGMDWIGSSYGVVRHSFFRASDDVIALMGNWDGYTDADMIRPGKEVHDITVEDSELSTSISNVVRAGWPKKIFNSRNFTLRNSDVLDGGIGACGQPFALLGFWGANGSRGDHFNYTFENIFLDHWYSLVQMEQRAQSLRQFTFRNIWALDQPPLVESSIAGYVRGVVFDNVKYGQKRLTDAADVPLSTDDPQAVHFEVAAEPKAQFTVDPPVFGPGQKVTLTAKESPHTNFTWLFGDGTEAHGRKVRHRFPDALGTELEDRNGAGRFRVLLHAQDKKGREDWAAQGVVAVSRWMNAARPAGEIMPGLGYQIFPGTWTEWPDFSEERSQIAGDSPDLHVNAQGVRKYAVEWDGFIQIPADGGYTFHLMSRDGARLAIDGVEVAQTGAPFAQVCGSPGNAVRYDRGALGLRAGLHRLHVEALEQESDGAPRLLWEAPLLPLADVPAAAFFHLRQDTIRGD